MCFCLARVIVIGTRDYLNGTARPIFAIYCFILFVSKQKMTLRVRQRQKPALV